MQSEAREALAKLRSVTENEWKQKYNLVTDEMRRRVEQLSSERERLRSEVKNYKVCIVFCEWCCREWYGKATMLGVVNGSASAPCGLTLCMMKLSNQSTIILKHALSYRNYTSQLHIICILCSAPLG